MKKRIKMIVQSPADRNETISIPYAVAWAAARGIAKHTHHSVILKSDKATVYFDHSTGGGRVEWANGDVTRFDERTTVSL